MMNVTRLLHLTLPVLSLLLSVALLSGCATNEKASLTAIPASGNSVNARAANEAIHLQGQPYNFGGESPIEGFDCSGLVYYVYNKHGIRLPRDTWSLAHQLPSVQLSQRQPGDLVFFNTSGRPYSHVGIYIGEDRFVHAPSSRTGRVMMSDLKQAYWQQRFVAVRRPQPLYPLSLNASSGEACTLH